MWMSFPQVNQIDALFYGFLFVLLFKYFNVLSVAVSQWVSHQFDFNIEFVAIANQFSQYV